MTFNVTYAPLGHMPLPGPEVFWMSAWDEWFDATFWMLVARNEHHTVVINTGPPAELGALNEAWRKFHPSGKHQMSRSEDERPARQLERMGVDPASVTHVLFTPFVVYTNGGMDLFPNAELCISRRGWVEDVFAPPHPHHLPREVFVPDAAMQHLLFDARDRVRLLADGEEVVPGIRVWESLVHHRSSLAICIDTQAGQVVCTDSAFSYRNVEENIYLGIGESYEEAMVTYARLRREADILIPIYEPQVAQRHLDGQIA